MLSALRSWRKGANGQHPSLADDGAESAGSVGEAAFDRIRRKKETEEALDTCGPAKEDFLRCLLVRILSEPDDEKIFREVERYFFRHAGPRLLAEWDWESIDPSTRADEEADTLRSVIRRSMAEAGVRVAAFVLGQPLAGLSSTRIRQLLEKAEWSVRRGDQTLVMTHHDAD